MKTTNYIKNWDEVVAHMLKVYPEEGAGFVTMDNTFYPAENLAENKMEAFEFDPLMLSDYDVKCIIHSHPYDRLVKLEHDPRSPSKADLQGQIDTAVEWAIVLTEGENVTDPLFWGDYNHRPPLMNRDFIHNIQDCLSFVSDWLYKECGFKMPAHAHNPDWIERGENHFEELYKGWGFVDVTHLPAERGDLVFYNMLASIPSHIGVMAEPNMVTHHMPRRLPVLEAYSVWKKYATRRIRHPQIKGKK